MSIIEKLDDFFINRVDKNESPKLDARIYFFLSNFHYKVYWRVFVRGKCALFGCNKKGSQGGGGYLPEDCYEWWCDRCGAEGINYQVFTRRLMYGDEKIKDFISALKEK